MKIYIRWPQTVWIHIPFTWIQSSMHLILTSIFFASRRQRLATNVSITWLPYTRQVWRRTREKNRFLATNYNHNARIPNNDVNSSHEWELFALCVGTYPRRARCWCLNNRRFLDFSDRYQCLAAWDEDVFRYIVFGSSSRSHHRYVLVRLKAKLKFANFLKKYQLIRCSESRLSLAPVNDNDKRLACVIRVRRVLET